MERRELLKLVALTALSPKVHVLRAAAACHMDAAPAKPHLARYKLQFFSEDESLLLDRLMEMIIPADSHSPGAQAAKTNLFADLMVATSDDTVKKQWQDGLRQIREEAARSSLTKALRKAAVNEGNAQTDLEQFFALLKQMTVDGYYTSETAIHQDIEYPGNTYLATFPGCTHREHQG